MWAKNFTRWASLLSAVTLLFIFVTSPLVLAAITIDEYSGLTANSQAHGIVEGSDANLWFTEFNTHQIGQMTANGTLIQEYALTNGTYPNNITVGPDDRMWFTEYGHETGVGSTGVAGIGVIDTSGNVTEYLLPTSPSPYNSDPRPHDIVTGPDGNLWFTMIGAHAIGRIQIDGTFLTPINLGPSIDPYGITLGPDGNIWVTDWGTNDQIIQISPAGSVLNQYSITGGYSQPYAITNGPDGDMWFTLQGGSQDAVARITISGQIDYFPLAANGGNSNPHEIVAGADNNLWFTEQSASQIGMITTDGDITEYPTPTSPSAPFGITTGPDNTIWFTESGTANQIGTISGLSVPTPPPSPPNGGGGNGSNGSGSSGVPGAPSTGFGSSQNNPLQTLLIFSLIGGALAGLSISLRKVSKQHS